MKIIMLTFISFPLVVVVAASAVGGIEIMALFNMQLTSVSLKMGFFVSVSERWQSCRHFLCSIKEKLAVVLVVNSKLGPVALNLCLKATKWWESRWDFFRCWKLALVNNQQVAPVSLDLRFVIAGRRFGRWDFFCLLEGIIVRKAAGLAVLTRCLLLVQASPLASCRSLGSLGNDRILQDLGHGPRTHIILPIKGPLAIGHDQRLSHGLDGHGRGGDGGCRYQHEWRNSLPAV